MPNIDKAKKTNQKPTKPLSLEEKEEKF